jgi:hypothetical protein
MMTISQAPRGGEWVFRTALIASLLAHLAILLLGMISYDAIVRALDPNAPRGRAATPQNEIVQITSVLHIERRASSVAAPAAERHEGPHHIAVPPRFGFVPSHTAAPPRNVAQIAFAEAMARHHGRVYDAHDPAQVPGKIRLAMDGLRAKLRRGQGIYYPTRGWRQDGEDYYDAAYEFIYPNGDDEKGVVPWPIHFDPSADPFFSADPLALSKTPLPSPPPGFVPPGDLGKALRAYFPSLHFEDADG